MAGAEMMFLTLTWGRFVALEGSGRDLLWRGATIA